jgi:methyltransferase (TIGR00027 family)
MSDGDLSAVGKTAFTVALARAREAARAHPWFVDPLAVRLAAAVPHATKERVGLGITAWVAVRTRFLDEMIVQAAGRGIRQVVIVGAGLDARGFRLDLPDGLIIYEVDREEVFAAKRRIVDAARLISPLRREIVIDVLKPGWIDAVADAGWRNDAPTLWILEGFLVYFDGVTRTRILTELADASEGRSELGATVSMRTDGRRNPLWHQFDTSDLAGWLAACGWSANLTDMTAASNRYGRPLPSGPDERLTGMLVSARRRGAPSPSDEAAPDDVTSEGGLPDPD